MNTYYCDACDLACARIHHLQAYGGDVSACDHCCGYAPEAYDEPVDLMRLHARADRAFLAIDKRWMTVHQRADLWLACLADAGAVP